MRYQGKKPNEVKNRTKPNLHYTEALQYSWILQNLALYDMQFDVETLILSASRKMKDTWDDHMYARICTIFQNSKQKS